MTILSDQMRKRLTDGDVLLGLGMHFPCTGILEAMCPGWDFVWIDMQHGQHDYFSALEAVRMTQALGLGSLVRTDTHDPLLIAKYADMGTTALLVPMVNSAAQARAIVRSLYYAPRGDRFFASRRLVDREGVDYHLRTPPVLLMQIETPQAGDEVAGIVAEEGVDGVFFGPDDYRLAGGIPWDASLTEHPVLAQAAARTAQAARDAGKWAAIPAPTPDQFKQAIAWGYQMVIGGGDAGFLRVTAKARIDALDAVRRGGAATKKKQQPAGTYA